MANYQYCVATNWGKGFITNDDSAHLEIKSFPASLWKVNANSQRANRWIAGVAGERKTLAEAQALVNQKVLEEQTYWDAIPADDPRKNETSDLYRSRPTTITLTE
tara:strand:- start:140 stop:454 length:315 start_codon:yes stop_codon:yes gene_type:complete